MARAYPAHARLLAWAIGELGVREVPPGSNTGPRVRAYQAATWLRGTRWPWCAAFVVCGMAESGIAYPDKTASAYDMLRRARKRGWATSDWQEAVPGDIVIFNVGSGHVAILEAVKRGRVFTVDGNSGDMVRRCERDVARIAGIIRWPETLTLRAEPSRATRFAQVVGGESGRRKLVTRRGRVVRLPAARGKVT